MRTGSLPTMNALLASRTVRLLFGLIWVAILAWCFLGYDGRYDHERTVVFLLILFVVGFPISLAGLAAVIWASVSIDPAWPGEWWVALSWAVCFFLSYCQWFVILPALVSRFNETDAK